MGTPVLRLETELSVRKITGECITREMTPEEIKKYKGDGDLRNKVQFTKDELIALCRIHGTNTFAVKKIYEILKDRAINPKQILNCIAHWKIKDALTEASTTEKKEPLQEEQQIDATENKHHIETEVVEEQSNVENADIVIVHEVENSTEESEEKHIVTKIRCSNYDVGNVSVEIDFLKELICIGDSREMTFKVALAVCDLIQEIV